jgi:hypothetical protein
MAELHRYPLRVQQSKLDGWWFVFVDEVPGLEVFVQITKTCLTGRQSWQETYFVHAEKSFLIWKLFHQRTRHYTCPIKALLQDDRKAIINRSASCQSGSCLPALR